MAFLNDSFSSEILDIDGSILEQVKRAINRVAATESSDGDNDFPSSSSAIRHQQAPASTISKLVEKQRQELEDQVMSLKAEIEVLEEELSKRSRHGGGEDGGDGDNADTKLKRTILSLASGGGDTTPQPLDQGDDLLSKLLEGGGGAIDREHQKLESQIRLNEALSGIKFESTDWEVIRKDDNSLLREHTHVGATLGYRFRVTFVINEEKSDAPDSSSIGDTTATTSLDNPTASISARIVVLRVEVDPRSQRTMQDFLARVCVDCDLMLFYRTYSRFCLFLDERKKAFKDAKSKFEESIHFGDGPNGARLHFSIQNGLSLNFTWSLSVSAQGNIERSISLQVKIPSSASDDVAESFSHMPQLLDKMISLHGHRKGFIEMLNIFDNA